MTVPMTMMKIRSVEFVRSVTEPSGSVPTDLPQVAFSGRSNVGKSSLINRLLHRHKAKIARVSASPGKTRALNFFRVNDRFYLVDLPGFGYAKAPGHVREGWKELIEGYIEGHGHIEGQIEGHVEGHMEGHAEGHLEEHAEGHLEEHAEGHIEGRRAERNDRLRGVVHLVDARHDPTPLDLEMMAYLANVGIPVLVVLTKMDKLTRSRRAGAVGSAAESLGLGNEQVLPFSAKTGEGREELLAALDALLEEEG